MAYIRMIIGVLIAIGVLAGSSAGVQAQSDDGLVAEWHFDEGSGSVLKDSSGNGNDGVIYGATWVEGKYGGALEFDGVDDYVNVPTPYIISDEFSIEAWVKTASSAAQTIFGGPTGDAKYHPIFGVGYGNSNGGAGCVNRYGTYLVSNIPINTNDWYHVVFVANDRGTSTTNMKIYINGVLDNEINDPFMIQTWPETHYIGKRASENHFNGIIDEIRIYNRVLTTDEIKDHYEGVQLSLTKSASPQSIKQGQTTTITLTIKNTGTTEIKDIEIADTIPQDLTFIDGETSKTYASLSPKDSREFQYILQFDEAGTFNLELAFATYADDEGNYKTVKSKPASIEVIPSLVSNSDNTPYKKSDGNVQTASVNLHGQKTDVALGEDVLLKLSAVNIIGNPTMHVQVIIIPPSGWSVTSSEFAKSGAGQYTTTYELESGGGKDIEVRIVPNQIGNDFQVDGRIIYYFGDDVSTREDHTLSLPIKVREEVPDEGQTMGADSEESKKTPGFGALVAFSLILLIWYLRNRSDEYE